MSSRPPQPGSVRPGNTRPTTRVDIPPRERTPRERARARDNVREFLRIEGDGLGGGTSGHGAVIMENAPKDDKLARNQDAIHAALATLAIQEYYD